MSTSIENKKKVCLPNISFGITYVLQNHWPIETRQNPADKTFAAATTTKNHLLN
jgi:hypothetical protein